MFPQHLEQNHMENIDAIGLLQENWGINPANIIAIPLGNALCWKVSTDTGEDLFFKQMRPEIVGSETRIEEILKVQNYFASQGLPVVKPSSTKSGSLYILNNGAFFIVYPFIQSKQKTHRSELNQRNLDSLADTLAKMHIGGSKKEAPQVSKVFQGWKSPEKFNATIAQLREYLVKKAQAGTLDDLDQLVLKGLDVKEKILNGVEIKYEELGLESDHLTHGDYQERNVYFDEKDDIEWIIDWDTCEMAPRSRELARAIDLLCIDRKDLSSDGLAKAKAFFQRYNAIYPITKEELYKGWFAHMMKTGISLFGYTEYYFNNDERAIRIIIDEEAGELERYFNKLKEVIDIITK